jgi:hypothetical protein
MFSAVILDPDEGFFRTADPVLLCSIRIQILTPVFDDQKENYAQ